MIPAWLVGALAVVFLLIVLLRVVASTTIYEFERGLKFTRGHFKRVLGPGLYWHLRPFTRIQKIDIRPTQLVVAGQEVLSSDGVTLKVSLAAEYEIADPEVAVNKVESADTALYLTLQLALREIVGEAKIDDVLARREEFGQRLLELASEPTEQVGLRLLGVNVKDIMFPGELKKIFAQVVQAQKEGQAALEKVRGETAALRGLANAARMIEGNPSLFQLRLLQQLAASGGNTVVLGFPTAGTPLPLKERKGELPETGEPPPSEPPE